MSEPILTRTDQDAVATLTLNNPKSLNALSDEMLALLQKKFDNLAHDTSIRCVIIKGAGKAFCAGHDLKEMTAGRNANDKGRAYFQDLFNRCTSVMLSIRNLPQPVIAQVHGIATAAGCQLVSTCDMAIGQVDTKFGVNGVNVGLFCSTPMVALSRNIPRKRAMEMLTTGGFLTCEEALNLGLINRISSKEEIDLLTMDMAKTVASKLGRVVKIGKKAFYEQLEMGVEDAYSFASDVMVQNMLYAETEEGINAFIEKRSPNWNQD